MAGMRAAAFLMAGLGACASPVSKTTDLEPLHGEPTPLDGGTTDAGARPDGGPQDAGPAPRDAGPLTMADAGPISFPSSSGWTFYGPQHGGPRAALGVSSDAAGNLWVAGGDEGLFLLTPGAQTFRRFTHADGLGSYTDASGVHGYKVLSVAGGPANTVFIGYEGVFGGLDDNDPPYQLKSGDADQVAFNGAGLTVRHFDLSSPPGLYSEYPAGRDKLRSVFRVVHDAKSGDVWFGGNHGIAVYDRSHDLVVEHQHAAINGYTASGAYTLLSGDWYGLALDGHGDVWMGGGHRVGKLGYAAGRNFWGPVSPVLDIWPDAVPIDGKPKDRTDDYVQDLAVAADGSVWVGSIPNGLAHWSPSGVAYYRTGLVDPKVTALEVDPEDGSVWVGHLYGGLSRLTASGVQHYDYRVFGRQTVSGRVPDLQSDRVGGKRRLLVAFESGAVGIYVGE